MALQRREFITMLAAGAAIRPLTAGASWPVLTWGPMDVDRYRFLQNQGIHLRVLLDGVDVTMRCTFADDHNHMVQLLLHNENGKPYFNEHGDIAREELTGNVTIVEVKE